MSTNPMIPSRKETPAAKEETNVEQPKKQLRDVLTYLGADVTMDDVDLEGEKAFVITIKA